MTISVSASTEIALRAAMARLLAGQAATTDGRLTVTNLAAEAGVSRATANRATVLLKEFQAAVRALRGTAPCPPREAGATELQVAREATHVLAQQVQALAIWTREQQRHIAALEAKLAPADPLAPRRSPE